MEGIAFILIGATLFSHSWHILGLYPDGRTMGLLTGSLGLATLMALVLTPMVLIGGDTDANVLAETNIMKMLIILWAGYGVAIGAQGLWDLDERALGFFSAVLTVASAVALFYFATTLFDAYGNAVTIGLSAVTLVLSVLAGLLFFYLAIPFQVLRLVTGWFILLGSMVVAGVGFAIISTVITVA